MYKFVVLFFTCLLFFSLCKKKGKHNPNACNGDTRREVKVCIDTKAEDIFRLPVSTTLKELGEISVPGKVKSNTARLDLELQTYIVTAKVDKIKKEFDGDYHIRLVDSEGNYLICESSNPGCEYAMSSKYLTEMINVRDFINSNDLEGKTVTITGVAFIDINHGHRKQANNNLELHPILKISF